MTVTKIASISTFIVLLFVSFLLFGISWNILLVGVPASIVLSIIYYKILKQVDKLELKN